MQFSIINNNTSLPMMLFNTTPFIAIETGAWYTYFMLTISILTLITCTVAMAFIYGRRKLLERNSNIMLFALIGSHDCIGVVGTIVFSLEFILGTSVHNKSNIVQVETLTMLHFLYIQAFMMITVITLDRLISVKMSFFYERCTWKSCAIMNCLFTIPAVLFLIIRFTTYLRDVYYMFVLSGCFVSVFICIANFILFQKVREELTKIYNVTVAGDAIKQMKKRQSCQLRQRKSGTICLLLSMSTVLTLLPSDIITIQLCVTGISFWNKTTIIIGQIADMLVLSNSLKDPLIYILLNKEVRQEVCRFIRRTFLHKKSSTVSVEKMTKTWLAQQRVHAHPPSNNCIELRKEEVEICEQQIIWQTVSERTESIQISETQLVNAKRTDTPIMKKKLSVQKSFSPGSRSSTIREIKTSSSNTLFYGKEIF